MLAEGGIVLFLYYCLPLAIMMFAYFKKNKKLAYWAVCMCMFWNVVIFHVKLINFFIIAFGYSMFDLEVANKQLHFSIDFPTENLSEEKGYFIKQVLCLPKGISTMMNLVLVFAAVYGILNADLFSIRNLIVSILVMVLEILYHVFLIKSIIMSRTYMNCFEIGLWLFYMLFGQAYHVLDSFYTLTDLHIQTCWWHSIAAAVVLIAGGVFCERIQSESKRIEIG